ncbi:hypothetical protein [Xylophilus sp. GOD-11R]|uniref:hypothetical protein n=1 Tax=Xylophilus sp. GOD-11R TaxID=3089814 RepID=UPI00298BD6AC|nr:hypothetical protein [Xylophilus sp. GOD-11R]WPB58508.1 hypothetical protein R9X41_07670 [Xylophilus sp. GOD-11R]
MLPSVTSGTSLPPSTAASSADEDTAPSCSDSAARASYELMPNELWQLVFNMSDVDAKWALSQVDRNLSAFFALPTARASAQAASSGALRNQRGLPLVRRAVAALPRLTPMDTALRGYLHDLRRLAEAIGATWIERDSLSTVTRQLCEVLPDLPRDMARSAFIDLMLVHQRCDEFCSRAERSRTCSIMFKEAGPWRATLVGDLACLHRANEACNFITPLQWRNFSNQKPECKPS